MFSGLIELIAFVVSHHLQLMLISNALARRTRDPVAINDCRRHSRIERS